MDPRCHHHPDREAAGTCCYCERRLCTECLSTNPQGKSFCRREEECLAYQDALSLPGDEGATPVADYLRNESSLETQAKRLSGVLEELGELRCLLEASEGKSQSGGTAGQPVHPHPLEADPRIPGICAGKLLQEADALLALVDFRIAVIRKEQESSGSAELPTAVKEVQEFIEQEAKPRLRDHADWGGRYSNADSSDVLDSIGLPFTKTSRIS
jgi:hypothetical protein